MHATRCCRPLAATASSTIVLAVQTRRRRENRVACSDSCTQTLDSTLKSEGSECERVGSAAFWTLLHYQGPGQSVVALRNVIEQSPEDGRLMFVKLAKRCADGSTPEEVCSEEVSKPPRKAVGERCRELCSRLGHWLFRGRSRGNEPAVEQVSTESAAPSFGDDVATSDSSLSYLQQRVAISPGEGFGQFCRLTAAAQDRLLTYYKSTAGLHGQANSKGVNVADASNDQCMCSLSQMASSLYSSILSDADVQGFEDVRNFRMPFSLQDNFQIHIGPMKAAEDILEDVWTKRIPQLRNLSAGWPSLFDVFRNAPFTGSFHGAGIVPAISKQTFVCGSGCNTCWVRFDKADLETHDHNLEGIPTLEDESGVFFPVTHLWIDFCFPGASYAMEWFYGARCLVRKELSLWPMPKALFQRLIVVALGYAKGSAQPGVAT